MKHHVIVNTLEDYKQSRDEILAHNPNEKLWSVKKMAWMNPPAYHMRHCPCEKGTWGPLDELPDGNFCNTFCTMVGETRMFFYRLHPSGNEV